MLPGESGSGWDGRKTVHTFVQDLRFAARTLRKGLLVTVLATLSLALAIAGNTTVFSLVNSFLYRPLPYPDADRIVLIGERESQTPKAQSTLLSSLAFYGDLQERAQTLGAVAAFRPTTVSLTGGERAVPLSGAAVTESFFPLLGTTLQRGRPFQSSETQEGGARVAVVSHEYWESTWGLAADPLNQVMVLNGEPHDVVGVLPAGWDFLAPGVDVYTPVQESPLESPRDRRDTFVLARMAPGVGMAAVHAETEAIASELSAQYPETQQDWTADAFNLRHDIPTSQSRVLFMLLQGSVLFVLLIACANVVNLLLARGQDRQREIALRTALGAGRGRIIRQLLTESLVLVLIGGGVGLGLGFLGIHLLVNAFRGQLPAAYTPVMDLNVLLFTGGVTLLAGLLFGLVPALQTIKVDQVGVLKEGGGQRGGGRRTWISKTLVVAEIALSLVALGGGSVLVRSFVALRGTDPGFDSAGLLTVQMGIPVSKYADDAQLLDLFDQIKAQTQGLPGVTSVTFANSLPQNFLAPNDTFRIAGQAVEAGISPPRAVSLRTGPAYLETLGVPLVQGRFFEPNDRLEQPLVAVINQALAHRYFPDRNPVGERIAFRGETRQIVGVAADVQQLLIRRGDASGEAIYIPVAQDPQAGLYMVLRASADPLVLTEPVRAILGSVDPDITLNQVLTMEQFVDQFFVGINVFNIVLAGFGVLALLLAALGTYGVLAYSVSQRTHEIGVRMAIGARGGTVVHMVARQGITLGLIGLGVGLVLTVPVTGLIRRTLEGLVPVQSATVGGVAVVLFLVTVIASVLPARRAAGVDPVLALRDG